MLYDGSFMTFKKCDSKIEVVSTQKWNLEPI
jgi:hypothetical protein